MDEPFDPYHEWLGIPPEHQPVNFYRLLGVPEFESDGDVISNAADLRLSYVKSKVRGERATAGKSLLKELERARNCLLKAETKASYDSTLAATEQAPQTPLAREQWLESGEDPLATEVSIQTSERQGVKLSRYFPQVAALGVVILIAVLLYVLLPPSATSPTTHREGGSRDVREDEDGKPGMAQSGNETTPNNATNKTAARPQEKEQPKRNQESALQTLLASSSLYLSFEAATVERSDNHWTIQDAWGRDRSCAATDVSFVNGIRKQCLRFDGNNGHLLTPIKQAEIGTLALLVNLPYTKHQLAQVFAGGGNNSGFGLNWHRDSVQSWRLVVGDGKRYNAFKFPHGLSSSSWYHIAFTFDSEAESFAYYKNGEKIFATKIGKIHGAATAPFVLSTQFASHAILGNIDDVLIFPRVLTPKEIQTLCAMR